MDTLMNIRVFCAVAELKSFTLAARRLGVSPAMASKHVVHLEARLSARLLNRTSRHVSLTETGALFFEQARLMMDGFDELEAAVRQTAVSPKGRLRLTAPVWMASALFARVLADYRARYPDVTLEVDLSGRLVNLIEDGFDLALRVTASPDPGLIARTIANVPFCLVASRGFLEEHGRPVSLEALKGAPLLAYSLAHADGTLTQDTAQGRKVIKFRPVLQSANETLMHQACLQGMGYAFLPKWLIADDLAEGRLEWVLPDKLPFAGRLLAVYPTRKYLSAKVRSFLDFIARDARLK
ncbi:DNA-binding transcriptional LysR family regulator [Bradyrhizobium macuxiense]|uniref:DNA-binding transcriptional LysR family regulator n=1 Tax=Bradyrhizobium macuxiense TaxID=1755647 RepID=A0A560L061_9BRAD|nr:LysR family transcriptional regulator [Bradyrhizobium macuxiense]TWB87764.1 DNA-binding transcriptional LysR family regulator [Bradyrhizobium macuxiense]